MKTSTGGKGNALWMFLVRSFCSHAVLIFALIFIMAGYSFIDAAVIKGRVVDAENFEALPAANVLIKGTSFGAAANLDGEYIITHVPMGTYTIVVTFIGYQTKEVEVAIITEGTTEQNFELETMTVQGKAVTVTAQAMGQIEAINQQLSSNTITNVVSKSKIHELPDDNAATALSRLPGISLQEGDKVVIRGIQAKLNTVLINGVQVPSTDMDDRSSNLGFISSNLLSGIEVIKALTPDMDANAIGGVVNLRLREAPSDLHFDIFAQGNYNTLDKTSDNYKTWLSVSNRFLDDKLGVFVQANADRANIGQDVASASFGIYGDAPYGLAPYQMDSYTIDDQWNEISNYGGSVILDYVLPNGKIVLQNTYAHNLSNNTTFSNNFDVAGAIAQYAIRRNKFNKNLMINGLQVEYNLGSVKTELSVSHSFADKTTDLRYGDSGQNMYFLNVNDPHPFGKDETGNIIQYAASRQQLSLDDALDIAIDPTDSPDAQVDGWVVARDEEFKQHLYNYNLDFTVPVTFSTNISSTFKFGGKFTRSTRNNNVEADFTGSYDDDYYYATSNFFPDHPNLTPQNPVVFADVRDNNYTRGDNFLNGDYPFLYAYDRDLMDDYMETSISGWAPARHMPYSERDDFDGSEKFTAGYIMTDLSIGSKLTLIGGLRYEHYNMDYDGKFVYCTHSVYGYGVVFDTLNTVNRNDENFFPNAQLRYKITDWADLRLAYTKTISRPDFKAIMPSTYFEPGGYAISGNTSLKPAVSTNYDAYMSFYDNKIGLFTVGGFYKKIEDTFFQTAVFYQNLEQFNITFPNDEVFDNLKAQSPTPSQNINTYVNNPHPAYVRGLELDWQTSFWYLPKPLNNVVFNINYTRAWSDMDYQQIRNLSSTVRDPVTNRPKTVYTTSDTIRNARLLYQGDDNLNVALGVDYKDFSGRLSFNLQGDVITSVGARPETDKFTGNIYRWDFTLNQKLPFEGLSVSLNGVNIFNNATLTYQKFRRAIDSGVITNKQSISYSPRIFQLNLRYSF